LFNHNRNLTFFLQGILIATGVLLVLIGLCTINNWRGVSTRSSVPDAHSDSVVTKKVSLDSTGKKTSITTETTVSRTVKADDCSTCQNALRDNMLKKGYDFVLMGMVILMVVLSLPYVTSLNFLGVFTASFRDKIDAGKAIINEAANAANNVPLQQTGQVLQSMQITKIQQEKVNAFTQSTEDTPITIQQFKDGNTVGKWGGASLSRERKITATLVRLGNGSDAVKVIVKVFSTNVDKPLRGGVQFHLPPSFPNPDPFIYVVQGVAKLELTTRGAFIIGAEADNSTIQLELNLADLPEAAILFKAN